MKLGKLSPTNIQKLKKIAKTLTSPPAPATNQAFV